MELIIKYSGRNIGFFLEGGDAAQPQALKIPEYTIQKIRAAGGPRLNVIAAKVAAALKSHVWPTATSVWVEQENKRLIACPA